MLKIQTSDEAARPPSVRKGLSMRRALCVLASLVVVAAFAVAPSVAQQKGKGGKGGQRILNVYNWSDYVDPAVLEEFTKSTGIKMRYDTFDTNEALEAKLLA